jgi:maltooligosyltrehalose trehalohydrolase
MKRDITLGATPAGTGVTRFLVWAPFARQVEVHPLTPTERVLPLKPLSHGYHQAVIEDVEGGSLYLYRLDGQDECPDPASLSQPQDIHGPSQVVEATFHWRDIAWHIVPWQDYLIYELHIGTFSPAGTFAAALPYFQTFKDLDITAIELMPIAQFPGARNWGYDGVYPYAVQHASGGPYGLRTFVDACLWAWPLSWTWSITISGRKEIT